MHQIGVGVLGPVYRAQDTVRDQLVAVKVFKVDAPPEQAEQIADALEAVVHALPRHRGLIELIAAGVERETAYLVMAHGDVPSLDTRLKPGVPLDAQEALTIIRTLADAIDAAHARGIVHGGLHPRDIFVDDHGGGRAAGFGVATALARAGVRVPVRRPYSPPERLTSAPIEPTADRFALGAIAFELLSGRRIVGTGAEAAARLNTPVPGADPSADTAKLQTALAAMLAEQPAHRPSSAVAFAQALTLALFPRGLAHHVPIGPIGGGVAPGTTAGASASDDRAAVNARDIRQPPSLGPGGVAAGAGAAATADSHDADGPTRDDLELFTRQGTLWESSGRDPRPHDDAGRWDAIETIDTGNTDEDPLTLFASETPGAGDSASAQEPRSAENTGSSATPEKTADRGTGIGTGAVAGAALGAAGLGLAGAAASRAAEAKTASTDDAHVDRVGGDRDDLDRGDLDREGVDAAGDWKATASAAADEAATARERVDPDADTEPVATRPDSILGLSSIPSSSSSKTAHDERAGDDLEDEVPEPLHAARAGDRPGIGYVEDEDDEADEGDDVDDASDDLTDPPLIAGRGPATLDDEPLIVSDGGHAEVDEPSGQAAWKTRHDQDDEDEDGDADEDEDAGAAYVDRDDLRPSPASLAARRGPYVSTAADHAAVGMAAAATSPTSSVLATPEPADVGSSVRVVALVLAVGLAVGGAGGYLIGQRSALRSATTADQTTEPGTDADGAQAPADGSSAPAAAGDDAGAASRTGAGAGTPGATGRPGASAPGRAASSDSSRGAASGNAGAAGAAGRAAAGTGRAPAATGRLTVTSTPARAEVAVNGVRRGVTPLTLRDLPLGSLTVRVTRSGYAPETRRVSLAASKPSDTVAFDLEPASGRRVPGAAPYSPTSDPNATRGGSVSGLGALYVVSRPMGARVSIDGRFVGATPLMLTDVSSGSHTVQIDAPGHKAWTTTVQVAPGQRLRVAASLEEGT